MMLFQWLVVLVAVASGPAFLFRLTDLDPRLHRWPIIVMHWAMAWSVAWGGYQGWMKLADFGSASAVLGPVLWLWISRGNWRDGVPPHYRRPVRVRASPLPKIDENLLSRVSGAGRK